MKNTKILAAIMISALSLSVISCKKEEKATEITADTTVEVTTTTEQTSLSATVQTEPSETEPIDPLYDPNIDFAVNPLTGIQDMSNDNVGMRSVAIVVNNCYAAMPQRGISEADVIYEYETEGGQTRLLCLFANVNEVPVIGSLRSARIVASDLAAGTNSIFIHYGRNARVPDHMSEWDIDDVDGNFCSAGSCNTDNIHSLASSLPGGTYFWRDSVWLSQRALEHTAVSDGYHILDAINSYNLDLEGETPMIFNYVPDNSVDIASGSSCSSLNVFFSQTNDDALFEYDSETGLYYKSQYNGMAQIDLNNGEQIAVTNVIVIYANICGHGDTTVDVYFEDAGNGYYTSQGKIIPITWTKDTPNDLITIYNENGEEVEVNRGVTYVCVVDDDYEENITINP